jgi:competence protein ComEC
VQAGYQVAFEPPARHAGVPLLERLRDAGDAERPRIFLWSPVALGAGVAAYFAMPFEPAGWLALVPLVAALMIKSGTLRGSLASAFATAFILAAGGFALAKLRVETVRAPVLEKTIRSALISGTVIRSEPRTPRGSRLTLSVEDLAGLPVEKRPAVAHVRLMLSDVEVKVGDHVRLTATLSPPAKPSVPGGFDYARTAWFEQVGAVGYAYSKPVIESRGEVHGVIEMARRAIESVRQNIASRIHAALPGETGAIAAALIMGERGGITNATNDAYRSSGLFHILSISGLHMVIMAGAVFYSVRLVLAAIPALALTYEIKKWAAAAGIAGTFGYLAISGGAFATVRSALMIFFIFGAVLLDRPALALRNVALSAFVILALYPESLFDAGFQMSFAAVTGLIAAYEEVRRRASRTNEPHPVLRVLLFFGGIIASTLIASAAVAPFAAYHFHQSQQYAVLANLVAIPICNIVVMPAALAALLLMPLGLEKLALIPMGYGIEAMTWCANFVAKLPGAVGHIPAIPWLAFALMVFGGLWLALWQSRLRILGAALILAGVCLAPFMPRPDVLIARNGELVALRGADGLLSALPARQSRYEMERWLEQDGDARSVRDVQRAAGFTCDGVGCVARVKGATVAVSRHAAAIAEDCVSAGVVVMSAPRPKNCESKGTVIDFFDVWRDGVHALYIEPDAAGGAPAIRIDTVAAHRGDRPWAPLILRRDPLQKYEKRLPRPRVANAATTGADGSGDESSLPAFAAKPEWLSPQNPSPPNSSPPETEFYDDGEDVAPLPDPEP